MRPRNNIRHFADEISKFIHCMNSVVFWLSWYSHKLVFLLRVYPNACVKFYKDKMPHATRVEQVGAHDDVIKWKLFPRYWPFARWIHRSPVNSPNQSQWRGALMFSLIWAWINRWSNNCEAGDLRRHRVHYDVIVMTFFTKIARIYMYSWWAPASH